MRSNKPNFSADYLRAILNYDADTGVFRWRVSLNNRAPVGSIAGSLSKANRYWHIQIDGKKYPAHRLAWLYVYGAWPPGELDHKDTIKHHNWIKNLRPATKSQNGGNRLRYRRNVSGYKGVSPYRRKWVAQIRHRGRNIYLGVYPTPEAAHAAYVAKAGELFGEFANAG